MKLLLTSSGIRNRTIHDALVGLLGKPVAESDALVVPAGLYPFPGGSGMAWRTICGRGPSRLTQLGWRSLGILELTALPHIAGSAWVPAVQAADALLVGGGDPLFIATWLRRSGLTELWPSVGSDTVYVGVSAGSIAATDTVVETYDDPPGADVESLKTEHVVFGSPDGALERTLVTGRGAGFVDVAVIPHLDNPDHPDASRVNAAVWASHIPAPTYAIDDDTALEVVDGTVRVVSEGHWELFRP